MMALDPDSVGRGWDQGEQFNPTTAAYDGYGRGANARKVADAEDEISYLSVVFPCLFAPYRDI